MSKRPMFVLVVVSLQNVTVMVMKVRNVLFSVEFEQCLMAVICRGGRLLQDQGWEHLSEKTQHTRTLKSDSQDAFVFNL